MAGERDDASGDADGGKDDVGEAPGTVSGVDADADAEDERSLDEIVMDLPVFALT